jgi:hypothetical protein
MIPEQLRPPLIDFVSRAEEIPNLRAAVIFGSAIKGDFNKKSGRSITEASNRWFSAKTRPRAAGATGRF